MSVAERLLALGRSSLDASLDAWSRAALLDTSAALVAGRTSDVARAAAAFARSRDGAEWSAFVDATAASALDLDDGHDAAGGVHIGSTVLPVLLATSDDAVPLAALRGAMLVGYEVGLHAGSLVSQSGGVYRASGYAAALGAAAARVVLEDGSAQDLRAAVRVAQAHAPAAELVSIGTREAIGWAAVVGVTAPELVFHSESLDTGGPPPSGAHIFDRFDDALLATSGYLKPYACCRAVHWALAAVERIGTVASPTAVVVTLPQAAAALAERRPRSLGHAQFAVPWLVARAVVKGPGSLLHLGSSFDDPETLALADRVELRVSTQWDDVPGFPARVEVVAADGTHVAEVVEAPGSPLDDVALDRKARLLLGPRADEVLRVIADSDATVGQLRAALAEGWQA